MAAIERGIETFNDLKTAVVVVSFSTKKATEAWIDATGCGLPVYIDEDRSLYRSFGLHRSISKVFGIHAMKYYGEKRVVLGKLPKPVSEDEEDTLQMGGDFTVHSSTRVTFVYPSQFAADRPTLEQVKGHICAE